MALRYTRQREAVLNLLRGSHSHPTADQVYDEIRKAMPHVSKGTIYRNLRILCESGDISELALSGVTSRFEGRPERHYHFRCRQCGQVFDLDEAVNHDLDMRVAERTGFTVEYHHLEFRGLCRDCRLRQLISNNKDEEEATH